MSRQAAVSAESVDTEEDTHTNGETREAPVVTESSVTADTTSSNSTAKSPAQIKEEKRKAIQAARLQRERELAALLAEEQALMEGESIVFFFFNWSSVVCRWVFILGSSFVLFFSVVLPVTDYNRVICFALDFGALDQARVIE